MKGTPKKLSGSSSSLSSLSSKPPSSLSKSAENLNDHKIFLGGLGVGINNLEEILWNHFTQYGLLNIFNIIIKYKTK